MVCSPFTMTALTKLSANAARHALTGRSGLLCLARPVSSSHLSRQLTAVVHNEALIAASTRSVTTSAAVSAQQADVAPQAATGMPPFHLAFPVHDVQAARDFYGG